MRWSQSLIPTLKQDPADAVIPSHKLLVRAGFIRQLTAGVYTLLPLGLRSLQKAEQVVRGEMDAAGAVELRMPTLQPMELWRQTGRDVSYGENLFRLEDRHGTENVLGPTHEEVVTSVVKDAVSSYKQLPLNVYQIQTKFRDEFRPRFGLLRVREFTMKDAYSFDVDLAGLDAAYDKMYAAYEKIYARCGIEVMAVEAESGPIGGNASHEFMAPCDVGEDTILVSDKGNYAANVEKAGIGEREWTFDGEPTGELEEVHTPGMPGIEEVGKFMKVKPKNMLKTLIFEADCGKGNEHTAWMNTVLVLAVVRGDQEVNEAKLLSAAKIASPDIRAMRLLPDERKGDLPIGFVGPHILQRDPQSAAEGGLLLVDPDAAQDGFWTVGANKVDHHVKHFNWKRDCIDPLMSAKRRVHVADIRNAHADDPSPLNDGGTLAERKGIELGHVFKLGTKYSDALDAQVQTESGERVPMIMGCYGIGVGRILIAAVEQGHDDRGIVWPTALAPFTVVITPIKYDGEMKTVADQLYADLQAKGIDVLLDDRDARPGSKFADADLIGIPHRITVGDRGLAEGVVEHKRRGDKDATNVPVADIVDVIANALK
ncbi:MAG: proline--tRNA ligase [Planctomycetota bacterium]